MHDWNMVVTVHETGFIKACRLLETMGRVSKTEFFNVLVMQVEDVRQTLDLLHQKLVEDPDISGLLARVVPATHTFTFQSPEIFETRAREIVSDWIPALADKSFHVRMRRRGFKGRMSSMEEERFLDEFLLDALEKTGTPGHIAFDNPDYIIAVETIGTRAGLSLWSREELQRYRLVRLD
jgi:tRNA(Ser,Leu) C12 N-acetylase TAN1